MKSHLYKYNTHFQILYRLIQKGKMLLIKYNKFMLIPQLLMIPHQ